MRYKFRAWDENNEVMEYGVNIDNGRPVKKGYQLYHTGNTVYHSQPMQFTGLVDVNGREIYEGDIVRLGSFISEDYKKIIGQVVFERGKFIVYVNDFYKYELDCMGITLEVIGNIYEHKHLLKENK